MRPIIAGHLVRSVSFPPTTNLLSGDGNGGVTDSGRKAGTSSGDLPLIPVSMSSMSAPVKATIDEYTALAIAQYRDRLTTSNNTPTLVRSLSMEDNTVLFIDVVATFRDSATKLTGGYCWATLSFARASGSAIALGTIDILGSHLSLALSGSAVAFTPTATGVDIKVVGKSGTSVEWSVRTTADRGNP